MKKPLWVAYAQKCARKNRMSFNIFNAPFETSTA